jgi:antitoxin ParD1/3/4
MATMTISLPATMRQFVERQAKAEGFATAGEYLRAVIRALQERCAAEREIEEKLLIGLQSPPIRATEEFWTDLEARAAKPMRPRQDQERRN